MKNKDKTMTIDKAETSQAVVCRAGDLWEILLLDQTRTTKLKRHNILWATDFYTQHSPKSEITLADITGINSQLICPRIAKPKNQQTIRTHDRAEVFTPKDIVSAINQWADLQLGHWPLDTHNWQDFVCEKRIEIACGEAPFIVSRYDVLSGKKILQLNDRVGFLDQKLQVISKYCDVPAEWLKWAKIAYQCTYGYEWQGDSLLIARENLFYTFVDYYNAKFTNDQINLAENLSSQHAENLREIVTIISWNIFQMDGLRYTVPMSREHRQNLVKIMDWDERQTVYFCDIIRNASEEI